MIGKNIKGVIVTDEHIFSQEQVINLFESVGWERSANHPERLMGALANSDKVFTAYIDGELVGLLATMSNTLKVFISYLCVLPEHQNRGIGMELLKRFLEHYDNHHLELTTSSAEKFYARYGFESVGVYMKRWGVSENLVDKGDN